MGLDEGATCDECGTKVGPHGCCATIRELRHRMAVLSDAAETARREVRDVRAALRLHLGEEIRAVMRPTNAGDLLSMADGIRRRR